MLQNIQRFRENCSTFAAEKELTIDISTKYSLSLTNHEEENKQKRKKLGMDNDHNRNHAAVLLALLCANNVCWGARNKWHSDKGGGRGGQPCSTDCYPKTSGEYLGLADALQA